MTTKQTSIKNTNFWEKPTESHLWGQHFCYLYETKKDFLNVIIPFIKAGLEANEFCAWVLPEFISKEEAIVELKKTVKNVSEYTSEGRLDIIKHESWYLNEDGSLKKDTEVLDNWVKKINTATERGFRGTRITGDVGWINREQWDEFNAYEELVNRKLKDVKAIAICTYPMEGRTPGEVIDIFSSHENTLVKRKEKVEHLHSAEAARLNLKVKQKEKQLKGKSIFLASTAHEMRNSLSALNNYMELIDLSEEGLGADTDSYIETMHQQVSHMKRLVNDLLDSSRYMQKKIKLDKKDTDLRKAIQNVVWAIRPSVERKNIILNINMPEAPVIVDADSLRLEQVIFNIISNAVKFTESGGTISVGCHREKEGAVIEISDTGKGIDKKFISNIFEKFAQAPNERSEDEGVGLGLYIAKFIIDLHEGKIEADSDGLGKGSTFRIILPVASG